MTTRKQYLKNSCATYMRCFYLLVVFVLKLCTAMAQSDPTPSLIGHVVDQATGQPIGEVSIRLNEQGLGTIASPKGKFSLPIPSGYAADSVHISHLGYATRTCL
jgi:hypothetical protein